LENNLVAANTGNIKSRFSAWKTLFLESDMPECEVFFTTNLAKVAISNLKRLDDSFQYLKNNLSICIKLDSHLISFQFHAFP